MDLSLNKLSGSIPGEVAKLSNAAKLDFGYNRLTGPLPTELRNADIRIILTGIDLGECPGPEWEGFLDRTGNTSIDDEYCVETTPAP